MLRVLYIPLDERGCNHRYPGLLAEMTGAMELVTPSKEMLGKLKRPADLEKLWEWVYKQAPGCSAAILSVDTLVYGNLVCSRLHHRSWEQCRETLDRFRVLKERCPFLKIHAFNLVTRVAAYDGDYEDPDYWSDYGLSIWKHAYLTDKLQRGDATQADKHELQELAVSIPTEYLSDFLSRRKVNRQVNLASLALLKENVFTDLVVPKDDTAVYGYAAMDQQALSQKTKEWNLMHRVMVYPGADEVGCVLTARVFLEHMGFTPKVLVRYSSVLGPQIIPKYEDRPLQESIKAQVASLGGYTVGCGTESNLLLAVHSPGETMTEAGSQDEKGAKYYSLHSMHEFFSFLNHYADEGKCAALADVCFCNGADKEMMSHALQAGVLDKVCAYGGWNTAMNTVGMVLAHGAITACLTGRGLSARQRALSDSFLARKIIEDWLYQGDLMYSMLANPLAYYPKQTDPYHLNGDEEPIRSLTQRLLDGKIHETFPNGFHGHAVELRYLWFPWSRLFDIDFDFTLA